MKKYIYLLAIISVIAACKKPKDPEPVKEDPQVEPEKPAVQLKQLIARNVQMGVMVDQFLSFTYNTDGFVETVLVEINKQTGEKISKTLNTLVYETKNKLVGSNYITIIYNTDASKNDTTWVTNTIVYELDKIILKKSKTYTQHVAGLPTNTYEDKEKDFLYIQLDSKNRMVKWWTSQGQSQEFEYDEKGNYIKTRIISKYNDYYLSFKYDDKSNIINQISPCSFFARVASTGPFWGDVLSANKNNVTNLNISDTNPTGFEFNYEYNSEGYPTKRSSIIDPMTLEYIY